MCREHGYLAGEHFTCNQCGQPAEVYSRITGYYRPVQNWNAGKTQEFKERREYVPAVSGLDAARAPVAAAPKAPEAEAALEGELLLFVTATCPNCRAATMLLDKAGVAYRKLYAVENKELALQYGIKQAPTLAAVHGDAVQRHVGVADIKRFLQAQAVTA